MPPSWPSATSSSSVRSGSASTGWRTPRHGRPRASLERIVSEHDYDLAVLAQWDGRRRYANIRKLGAARALVRGPARPATSRASFASSPTRTRPACTRREALAEDEGSDAVRLLTMHAAKGLEFPVVVVADAGRDRAGRPPRRSSACPDGRFGFKVADPLTGARKGAFDYDELRLARGGADEAERRRLYYVAMTRAIDRLIVTGSIDAARVADERTPIGWVLDRLDVPPLDDVAEEPVVLERGERAAPATRRPLSRPDAGRAPSRASRGAVGRAQLSLFDASPTGRARGASRRCRLAPVPEPPSTPRGSPTRALAIFEDCSYRYYAERVAGMRERRQPAATSGSARQRSATLCTGARASSIWPRPAREVDVALVPGGDRRGVRERIRTFVEAYRTRRSRGASSGWRARRRSTRSRSSTTASSSTASSTCSRPARSARRRLQDERARGTLARAVAGREYRIQRLVYALACFRAGAERSRSSTSSSSVPRSCRRRRLRARPRSPLLEEELSAAIARIRAGEFVPTPSESACADCPALDVVCAGPRASARVASLARSYVREARRRVGPKRERIGP